MIEMISNMVDLKDTAFPQSGQHPSTEGCKLYQPFLPYQTLLQCHFSIVSTKFPFLWLAERILLAGVVESNPGPTSVCAATPHAGAGASAHVLKHITSPTKHTTPTQANNTKLAPTPKNTLNNPIKTPRATGINILQVNTNSITNKQEELKQHNQIS